MICTISPSRNHVEQSRNTLLFASCAKQVTINAQVNVVMSEKALVKQLQKELGRLEGRLKSMGSSSAKGETAALLREKELLIEQVNIYAVMLCIWKKNPHLLEGEKQLAFNNQ